MARKWDFPQHFQAPTGRHAAGALVLLLTGCSGPILTGSYIHSSGISGFHNYGAAGRDLTLVVQGTDEASAQLVEKTAQSVHGFQAPTHPTRNPGLSALPDYRLVFAFDAPPGLTGKALCAGKTGRAPTSDRQEVQAAYCLKDMVLTEVRGSSGRTEADLRHLIEQSMLVLFQQDPASHTDTKAWP